MQDSTKKTIIKSMAAIITSLIIGAIVGIIGFVRLGDSTIILARANETDISELKGQVVPRNEWDSTTKTLLGNDVRIESKLDSLLLQQGVK